MLASLLITTLALAADSPPEDARWLRTRERLHLTQLVAYGAGAASGVLLYTTGELWPLVPLGASELTLLVTVPIETALIRRNTVDGVTIAPMVAGGVLLLTGAAISDPLAGRNAGATFFLTTGAASYSIVQPLINHYTLKREGLTVVPHLRDDARGVVVMGYF